MKLSNSIFIFLTILITVYIMSVKGVSDKKNKIMYNDGKLVVLNDPVYDPEVVGTWNEDIDQNKYIPPISALDVKCMMHVDRYCSKSMAHTKGLLIRALKDDCENCSIKEKESVGKIVASMWAHDTHMWKLFLKRFDSTGTLKRLI